MEKIGRRPKVYIGSGTNVKGGIRSRLGNYRRQDTIPFLVEKAIKDGYTITQMALLCSIPRPVDSLQTITRTFVIALEATFSFMLRAMRTTVGDYGMSSSCLWDLKSLEYDGLCTHCALTESIAFPPGVTNEEHEAAAAERLAKARQCSRDTQIKTRAAKTYYCSICKIAKPSQHQLDLHNATPRHRHNAAPRDVQEAAMMSDPAKPFRCTVCCMAFPIAYKLERHENSERHKAKVEALAEAEPAVSLKKPRSSRVPMSAQTRALLKEIKSRRNIREAAAAASLMKSSSELD
jgi:hypothetical protein